MDETSSHWVRWARRLQSIAQTGLAYPKDQFDVERFHQVSAVAAEIMAAGSGTPLRAVQTLFAAQSGHATPKVDVRGVVFRAGGILLVRELADAGRWTLPGGWADPGESPADATVREVREESGFETRAVKLLAVLDRNKHPHPPSAFDTYKLFFRCEIIGGAAADSTETDGAAFFGEHELPELSTARVLPQQIKRLFEHFRDPTLPTDFD